MADEVAGHGVRDPHRLHARVEAQLDQAARELTRRMRDRVGYDVARQAVTDAYQRLARHARVRNFLPILAARAAQERLRDGR